MKIRTKIHPTPAKRAALRAERLEAIRQAIEALSASEYAYFVQLVVPGQRYGLADFEAGIARARARGEVERAREGKPIESPEEIRRQLFGKE